MAARIAIMALMSLVSALWLSPGGAQAQSAGFRAGLSAFNRAEYQLALENWAPIAASGDREAQSGLGFIYYKGLGVPRDYQRAYEWYARAAAQGQAEAQMFLGALYLYGDGVARDLVRAYAWCEISQSSGAQGGLGCREEAERHMSSVEIDKGIKLTSDWYAAGPRFENR